MSHRVVISGAGVISSIGAGMEEFERALFAGASGIGPSERFDGAPTAEIAGFAPQQWLGNKGLRVLDRSARLLSVAAHLALDGNGLAENADLGMVCGTMFGSVHSIAAFDWSGITEGPSLVNPMEFPNTVINSPAGQAAIKFRLRGVNSTVSAGLSSGLCALQYAAEFVRFGRARVLLAGGLEELCEESLAGFRRMGLLSPSGAVRPFADDRDGTIPGEGAALCVVETEESARARGAKPWVEIAGFAASDDAAWAMETAIARSNIEPERIALVVASANGTRAGDEIEARAIGKLLDGVPVYAPKAALGEAMGASGAFAALAAAIALMRRTAPSGVGLRGEYALVNAFGCDGGNASLVIRLWNE